MKKCAIVIDFDPKMKLEMSNAEYDIYILDRYHDQIGNIITPLNNEDFEEEMTITDFYQRISKEYQSIFCLFLSYQYSDIEDHLLTKSINEQRKDYEAKMITYLINFKNQNKQQILKNTLEMITKGYNLKDIIVRNHQIREKETFSLNEIIMRYISCLS